MIRENCLTPSLYLQKEGSEVLDHSLLWRVMTSRWAPHGHTLWEYISHVIRKINHSNWNPAPVGLGYPSARQCCTPDCTASSCCCHLRIRISSRMLYTPLLYISVIFVPHFCYLLAPFQLPEVDLPACCNSCSPQASSPECQPAEHGTHACGTWKHWHFHLFQMALHITGFLKYSHSKEKRNKYARKDRKKRFGGRKEGRSAGAVPREHSHGSELGVPGTGELPSLGLGWAGLLQPWGSQQGHWVPGHPPACVHSNHPQNRAYLFLLATKGSLVQMSFHLFLLEVIL